MQHEDVEVDSIDILDIYGNRESRSIAEDVYMDSNPLTDSSSGHAGQSEGDEEGSSQGDSSEGERDDDDDDSSEGEEAQSPLLQLNYNYIPKYKRKSALASSSKNGRSVRYVISTEEAPSSSYCSFLCGFF
jgi:hypothetical protein